MTHPLTHPLDLVEATLADLGTLHRRAEWARMEM